MNFVKQGKEMENEDVVLLVESVITENILESLEEEEIRVFLERLTAWHDQKIKECVEFLGYSAKDFEKTVDLACKNNLIINQRVWEKARKLIQGVTGKKENIKDELVTFIRGELWEELKASREFITYTEKQKYYNENYI